MSQENVELVRRLYEAWQRDGFGVVAELMDPGIEWVNPPNAVEPGTRRGYAAFAAAAESFVSVYLESRFTDVSFHDAGDRIAVSATMSSRGGGSEFPIETRRGYVFELRDGRVTRFSWFTDPLEAIEAVGMTADAGRAGRERLDRLGSPEP
jgi:ketosteroid isomerase-like protein